MNINVRIPSSSSCRLFRALVTGALALPIFLSAAPAARAEDPPPPGFPDASSTNSPSSAPSPAERIAPAAVAPEGTPAAASPAAPASPPAPAPPPTPASPPPPPPPPAPVSPASASEEAGPKLKEVVVTAQRREQTAQTVPSALSVLSGDNLTEAGIGRSAKEVLDYVPNATAAAQLHGRPRWWIRGIGTGQQQLDFPNPVGFYLDDVYISNASSTGFPLFDLDRVEILRGPQGTLWGKNTTGGAINVLSRRPDFTPDGYLKFDGGTFNDRVAEGAGGGSVWKDKLAARASFHYEARGGRFDNLYVPDSTNGQFQDAAFRLQLLGKPTPDLEVLANVHFRKYTTAGTVGTVSSNAADGSYLPGYVPSTDINTVNVNALDLEEETQNGASVNLKWKAGGITLTSISGYEDYRDETFSDSDYTPIEISRGWAKARSYQLSEELRLASSSGSGAEDRFNWVAGLFAFHEDIDRASSSAKLPGVSNAGPGPANFSFTQFNHKNDSFAPFASGTLNLTDVLSLAAGVRWTYETRKLEIDRLGSTPGAAAAFSDVGRWWLPQSVSSPLTDNFSATPSKSWSNVTFDVTPQVQVTRSAKLYARYAHGVKSGGFNTAATSLAALNVVAPEKLDDFEVGAKTSWWNGRIVANASAFRYNYSDIQVNVVGPLPPTNTAVSYLQNVKKGRVNGGELELDVLPVRELHVGGSLGLLDTKFTDFQVLNNGPNYSGNQFVRSPHVSSLLRVDYRLPLPFGDHPSLVLAADWRYQSRQFHYTTNQTDPLLQTRAFSIINARLSLASGDEKLILTLYANNLANVHYRSHSLPGARGATGDVTFWGDPLTVGASLLARWW